MVITAALVIACTPWDAHGGKEDGGNSYRLSAGVDIRRLDGDLDSDIAALWPLARGIERERVYVPVAVAEVYASDGAVVREAAPPSEVPAIRGAGSPVDGWIEALICSASWPCAEALAVAWCESRLDPRAVSGDGANIGLFQINIVHRARVDGDVSRLLDAATNVRVAYDIWIDNGGWGPWSCKPVRSDR